MTVYDLLAYVVTGVWASGGLLTLGLWASLALRDAAAARRLPLRRRPALA